MVEIRQRKGPSGPFGEDGDGVCLFRQSIAFGQWSVTVPGFYGVENSNAVYLYPVPPAPQTPGISWSVIANPSNFHAGELPTIPGWQADGWVHSHVRLVAVDVDMNAINPLIPVGTLGVRVAIGMHYGRDVPLEPVVLDNAQFDIMLCQQAGTELELEIPGPIL